MTAAWFMYGVVPAGFDAEALDGLVGVGDHPVAVLERGPVAAVVSPFEGPGPSRGAELLAYQRVLDAVAEAASAVAPVRFGSVLDDEGLDVLLDDRGHDFAGLLDTLHGRRQHVVQGRYEQDLLLAEIVAAHPEVAALREATRDLPEDAAYGERVRLGELVARAVEERQEADAAAVLDVVAPVVAALLERPVSGLERAVDAALLVDDARLEELEVRLEQLAEELHPRIQLELKGPMAPYDFVGDQ